MPGNSHTSADLPDIVFVRVSEFCNARCKMCSFWESPRTTDFPRTHLECLLRELGSCGVREVVITGGEPFLYPSLETVLEHIAEEQPHLRIVIITNGSRRDELARRILRTATLARVHVSLDALHDSGMARMRGRDGWYSGILEFVRMVRVEAPRVAIVANAIINQDNKNDLLKYCKHDFDYVNYLNLKGHYADLSLLSSEEERAARVLGDGIAAASLWSRLFAMGKSVQRPMASSDFQHIWGRQSKSLPCVLTSRMAYIDHVGNVYPCNCLAYGRTTALGNVIQSSFSSTWTSQEAAEFRRSCRSNDWVTCESCDPANRLYNLLPERREDSSRE